MGQAGKRDPAFAERLNSALGGRDRAWLVRETGISRSTMGEYFQGTVPRGDTLFRLADALGVKARWLATGLGKRAAHPNQVPEDDPETVMLPLLDLMKFRDSHRPEPSELIPVRRDWLLRSTRQTSGLWLTEMPSDAMPKVAREGGMLICTDAIPPLVDGRIYIFLLSGRPLVRKVSIRLDALVLRTGEADDEPIMISPDQVEDLVPIGRVVASIALQSL